MFLPSNFHYQGYVTAFTNEISEVLHRSASCNIYHITGYPGVRGGTVVKVLCYKSEGRWFDPSWCRWNFSLTLNPADRAMALGSTQPLTEMSTRSIPWG